MQKIKEVLSGNSSHDSTTASGQTSREYTTGSADASGRNTSDMGITGGNRNSTASSTTGATGTHTGETGSMNPVGSGSQRYEETGPGKSVGGLTGNFADPHKIGHDSSLASKFDPSAETTTHDHKHLAHVTHRDVRHVETEEVERQKEHERHVHHVQHHVQPVLDKQVNDEVHHEKVHPVTKITEQHVNTDEDRALLKGLHEKHRDEETHRAKERTVVDRGEKVHEQVHHHVHHVTQPVVKQEVHDRHRIHTVIPTHHVTHEAPIIHKSSLHEPIGLEDFKKGGGVLGSDVTMENAGVLQSGECKRDVDGIGEKLAQELHLTSGTTSSEHKGTTHI